MDWDVKVLRGASFSDYNNDQTTKQCFDRLRNSVGDLGPSLRTVKRWYLEFKNGRKDFSHRRGTEPPCIAVTQQHIDAVNWTTSENPQATWKIMEHEVGIRSAALDISLYEKLELKKVCVRWVSHWLTETQKQPRKNFAVSMLKKFDKKPDKCLQNIATEDETWTYYYDPLTKKM
jgi:hypothetical protein